MKNYIFKITAIMLVILFIFSLNCFATINTKYREFPEHETYTSEDYHYIIFNTYETNKYTIYFIPKNFDFYMYIDTDNRINFVNNNSSQFYVYFSDFYIDSGYTNDNYYLLYKNKEFRVTTTINTPLEGDVSVDGLKYLVYSEFNIYSGSDGFTNNLIYATATTNNNSSTETTENVIKPNDTIYNVALNIYTILSVLTFTIIIYFLVNILRICFKNRQG